MIQTIPPASNSWPILPDAVDTVLAVLVWPEARTSAMVAGRWSRDRAPPPLAFLRTVVLRC